jgi:hypothetical protein
MDQSGYDVVQTIRLSEFDANAEPAVRVKKNGKMRRLRISCLRRRLKMKGR